MISFGRRAGPQTPRWPYRAVRDDPIFDNCEICLPMVGGQDAGLRDEINDEKATFAGADTGIFAAQHGSAYTQSATNGNYVDASWAPTIVDTNNWSFSVWVRLTSRNVVWSNGSARYAWFLDSSNVYTRPSTFVSWSYTVPLLRWVHLGMTWSSTTAELWVDGISQGTNSITLSSITFTTLGGYTASLPIGGQMRGAMHHSRALESHEWERLADPSRAWSMFKEIGRRSWFGAAVGGGTRPQGPLGHPFHGPFAGPIGA